MVHSPVRLLVGLGNPGMQYQHTRHNAGEDFVRAYCAREGVPLKEDKRFFGYFTESTHPEGGRLRLLIPTTFMNRSGQSVAAVANFFKIEPGEILVAYDELDLAPGVARFKYDGGHGGHNGLRDIISSLGNRRDFYRLRIGIGHPGEASRVTGYVLGKAGSDDQAAINGAFSDAESALPLALAGQWEKAMHKLHTRD